MEQELIDATAEYEYLFRLYRKTEKLAMKHSLRKENLRKRLLMARDEKRALERDILSAPIISSL